jgi:hypothetical protein
VPMRRAVRSARSNSGSVSPKLPLVALAALALLIAVPGVGSAAKAPSTNTKLFFAAPVAVTGGAAYQAGEPSIRVDRTDANQRIWIAAPTGIGVDLRREGGDTGGDLFWYSDDDGKTFTSAGAAGGVASPTVVGGGDSDVATGFGSEVYGTGLTLANITLAASCDNGSTFTSNPVSNTETAEDRQWIDAYQDRARPGLGSGAPDFGLDFGAFGVGHVLFHGVDSPACAPPVSRPAIDVMRDPINDCNVNAPDCYQWPGNLAIDENTGDVYVTYNTVGNDTAPYNDDIVVTRVDGGASRLATQADAHPFTAANDRPDTFDSFTVVAVDKAGNVYVVWSERHPNLQRTDTMLAVSKDKGATWSKPIQVNTGPQTTTFPWIVAGDAGKIDIVYYGTDQKGPSPETVPATSKWKVYLSQSLNALAAAPTFKENPATGFIHQGSICTSGTDCATGTRDLLDFFQIDVDKQGNANITYTDNLNTPPDGTDPHQEWIMFVQQKGGKGLFG